MTELLSYRQMIVLAYPKQFTIFYIIGILILNQFKIQFFKIKLEDISPFCKVTDIRIRTSNDICSGAIKTYKGGARDGCPLQGQIQDTLQEGVLTLQEETWCQHTSLPDILKKLNEIKKTLVGGKVLGSITVLTAISFIS